MELVLERSDHIQTNVYAGGRGGLDRSSAKKARNGSHVHLLHVLTCDWYSLDQARVIIWCSPAVHPPRNGPALQYVITDGSSFLNSR